MLADQNKVVLVNEQDHAVGVMEKIEAHKRGLLHRAFSILIYNEQNELLMQQRALSKYHCGGLWTNTCCSHPFPNEDLLVAADRRLKEEMGITCELQKHFDFVYKVAFDNGLTEHEFDHVFVGRSSTKPTINTNEVADWKYISIEELKKEIANDPGHFTPWFKIIIEKMDR